MDSALNSIALASYTKDNSKEIVFTDLDAKYNQTALTMLESGMTQKDKAKANNISQMDQYMKANGERTRFTVSAK